MLHRYDIVAKSIYDLEKYDVKNYRDRVMKIMEAAYPDTDPRVREALLDTAIRQGIRKEADKYISGLGDGVELSKKDLKGMREHVNKGFKKLAKEKINLKKDSKELRGGFKEAGFEDFTKIKKTGLGKLGIGLGLAGAAGAGALGYFAGRGSNNNNDRF